MKPAKISFYRKTAVVWTDGNLPITTTALLQSESFTLVATKFLQELRHQQSPLLDLFPQQLSEGKQEQYFLQIMQALNKKTKEEIIQDRPEFEEILTKTYLFHQLIEEFYNYWRNYERYLVCLSENGANFDERPYRTFNDTISLMNDLVRKAYRDVCENLTGDHPTIYRQLSAGFQVGLIAVKKEWPCPENHSNLKNVPFIRQVLLNPPLIIDPFMNKRTGQFTRVKSNPLEGYIFDQREWMCYPAIVGDFLIHVYFHNKFIGLGCALSNLFQLANNADLKKQPDAVYAFGLPENRLHASCSPTIFYDEEEILFGAVPCSDNFGYFGYLKKMILTLHNILAMKKGRMPIHGAMVSIELKQGGNANVIILGDSGAGKSESLEAFRILGKEYIRDMTIIFDDMGSLDMKEGKIIAYGTEIGAFVRLDDLQPGFAFGNLDRSIIMSPQKINARAVLPVTNIEEVLRGYTVDYFLYANNYEKIDDKNPYLERFIDKEVAFEIFKKGAVMSKGTTTTTGLVSNYFANIFGPPQYQELHETIAKKFFDAMFENNLFIGQLRTQLGIQGKEITGPEEAAKALFRSIQDR